MSGWRPKRLAPPTVNRELDCNLSEPISTALDRQTTLHASRENDTRIYVPAIETLGSTGFGLADSVPNLRVHGAVGQIWNTHLWHWQGVYHWILPLLPFDSRTGHREKTRRSLTPKKRTISNANRSA
jgi:hypothetical protein